MPAAAQLPRDVVVGAAPPGLARRPAPRPRRQPLALGSDPRILLGHGPRRAVRVPAAPPAPAAPASKAARTPAGPPAPPPRSPSEHSRPPQAAQPGRGARRRTCTPSGSPASSSTPSTSTSPSPNISSHARRGCLPQGSSRCSAAWRRRFWGIPRVQPRMVSALLRPQTRSARNLDLKVARISVEAYHPWSSSRTGALCYAATH